MIFRLLWMDQETRKSLMVNMVQRQNAPPSKFRKVASWESEKVPLNPLPFPEEYLGKEEYEKSIADPSAGNYIYVEWSNISKWDQNKSKALFWSADELYGFSSSNGDIRIEDLCWVLDKERLAEPNSYEHEMSYSISTCCVFDFICVSLYLGLLIWKCMFLLNRVLLKSHVVYSCFH